MKYLVSIYGFPIIGIGFSVALFFLTFNAIQDPTGDYVSASIFGSIGVILLLCSFLLLRSSPR